MEHALVTKLQNKLSRLIEYLHPHLPFLNSHMVNFITHGYWERYVQDEIRTEIETIGHDNLMDLIREIYYEAAPSTCSLKQENTRIFLNESYIMRTMGHDVCLTLEQLCSKLNFNEYYFPLFGVQKIMSEKKTHEVKMVSAITNVLCKNFESKPLTVIDIGGGKGYLSSLLAMEYQLKVLGLDSNSTNTQSAAKRDSKLQKYWKSKSHKDISETSTSSVDKLSSEKYKQITQFVDESLNLEALMQEQCPGDCVSGICITGLHTCGNLSASSLRLYRNNKDAKAIINVGCCYHLLDEQFSDDLSPHSDKNYGFPMSEFLQSKKFFLGRNARMLSSQSLDRRVRLEQNLSKSLLYRALLQVILENQKSHDLNIQVGRIGVKCKTFEEYINKVKTDFKLDIKLSDQEISAMLKAHEYDWFKLQSYHTLKILFAPILELLILLDRYLYLLENGYDRTFLVKLFDPVISPRCYAIISVK